MNNGYDFNAHHDSHCEGSYCNCDNRNYGHSFDCSGVVAAICVILAILVSLIFPPLGFIIFWGWVLCSKQDRTDCYNKARYRVLLLPENLYVQYYNYYIKTISFSRKGEFYGTGHKEQIAIVSKDTGFNAVCDYWSIRLPENEKVIVAPSIERAMIASDERSNRVKTLKSETAGADIGVYEARYRERRKLRELLKEIFGESEYANQIPEIQEMLKTEKTLKATYLGSLHRFGRKQGTVIYSRIKPLLEHEIA